MKSRHQQGFTLIEVVIVTVIIGILAAIAYPNYQEYILHGNRTEGMALLNEAAARQERYFAQNGTYADTVAKLNMPEDSSNKLYKLSIKDVSANTYTLTATAQNAQAHDSKCANLGLDEAGARSETGSATVNECWK